MTNIVNIAIYKYHHPVIGLQNVSSNLTAPNLFLGFGDSKAGELLKKIPELEDVFTLLSKVGEGKFIELSFILCFYICNEKNNFSFFPNFYHILAKKKLKQKPWSSDKLSFCQL